MFRLQKIKDNKKHCLRGLLRRDQKYSNRNRLQDLSKRSIEVNRRLQEGPSKRTPKLLLFSGMFKAGQWYEKQNRSDCSSFNRKMQILQNQRQVKRKLVLLGGMQGAEQRRLESKASQNMRSLRRGVCCEYSKTNTVLKRMSEIQAFRSYDRAEQFFLQARRFSSNYFSKTKASDNRKRRWNVCSLWSRRQVNCSSYKSRPYTEPFEQSYNTLQFLSYHTPQVKEDYVSSISRNCYGKKYVYDIEVEKNNNFFANLTLIHNCFLIDDPIKGREQADSETIRSKIIDWFGSVAYTRLMTDDNAIIIILTRWHYDDLAGYAMQELSHEDWDILDLPAIAEHDEVHTFENGDQWIRKEGEPLWPEWYSLERLNKIKQTLKTRDWSSLYQQSPQPDEGGMVQLSWFDGPNNDRRFDIKAPPKFEAIYISADTAFKEKAINDPSALLVFGESKGLFYLIDVTNKRMAYPDLKQKCIDLQKLYRCRAFLIEDKASGQSLAQDLKTVKEVRFPVIAIEPEQNKILRLDECTGFLEAGYLRLPKRALWLTEFELQLSRFPYDKHDDMVDALSQFLKWKFKVRKTKVRKNLKSRFWK